MTMTAVGCARHLSVPLPKRCDSGIDGRDHVWAYVWLEAASGGSRPSGAGIDITAVPAPRRRLSIALSPENQRSDSPKVTGGRCAAPLELVATEFHAGLRLTFAISDARSALSSVGHESAGRLSARACHAARVMVSLSRHLAGSVLGLLTRRRSQAIREVADHVLLGVRRDECAVAGEHMSATVGSPTAGVGTLEGKQKPLAGVDRCVESEGLREYRR
jgi:hypothetical protein